MNLSLYKRDQKVPKMWVAFACLQSFDTVKLKEKCDYFSKTQEDKMIMNNFKKPLEKKLLLSKLFFMISLSLISVLQTEAQYIIEEENLQKIIKSDNPNLERIREIIDQKPWIVFAIDKHGNTPLHDATRYGHTGVAALLLDRGADLESKRLNGSTALHYAAWYGRTDVAALLLDRGADVESRRRNGATALHDAAWYGRTDVAALLLDRGADIESKGDYGHTPLHDAAFRGHIALTALLLKRGANIESRTDTTGETPFQLAKNQEIRNLLTREY